MNLPLILAASFVAVASPGPATMAIARASMSETRRHGLAMASGITTVSFMWGTAAALGLGTLLSAHESLFSAFRYAGSGYLIYLAVKSLLSALSSGATRHGDAVAPTTLRGAYFKGIAIHLTNPKVMLFYGALYAIGIPRNVTPLDLFTVVIALGTQAGVLLHIYALLFSLPRVVRAYERARRWFEGAFALAFGAAGIRILVSRI